MKIEIKHIAPYLPFGLQCRINQSGAHENIVFTVSGIRLQPAERLGGYDVPEEYCIDCFNLNYIFSMADDLIPLLRPQSILLEEYASEDGKEYENFIEYLVQTTPSHCDAYDEWLDHYLSYPDTTYLMQAHYEIMEQLFENNIDVFDLIGKGLAEELKTDLTHGKIIQSN